MAADLTYTPKVYKRNGGDVQVVASGGSVTVESGGAVTLESGGVINGAGSNGILRTVRSRCTAAEIDAGKTLVAAVAGYKPRMVDCILIAYGGNAGGSTTVDILGTLSSGRTLVAATVGALTRSTVARAGDTNVSVLADGASFTANDANTAITIGKTGNGFTTATGVDVILTYVLEAA